MERQEVNGDQCMMGRGDLILTPSWTWHDHGCESDQPIIWMDGLDLPLVGDLDAVFFEAPPELRQNASAVNDSEMNYAGPHLQPTRLLAIETESLHHQKILSVFA